MTRLRSERSDEALTGLSPSLTVLMPKQALRASRVDAVT